MKRLNRRDALKEVGTKAGAVAAVFAGRDAFWQHFGRPEPAEYAQSQARRGLPPLKITDVKVIRTQVGGNQLLNVKVFTSEPGLYGVGDGNHAERVSIIAANIEKFLKPMIVGRNADEIEDIWQTAFVSTYWRSAVDANNAMAAIDGALWDIAGKRANMPVYNLLGGRVRAGCRMMTGANTSSPQALEDSIRESMSRGYQHFRFNGLSNPGSPIDAMNQKAAATAQQLLPRPTGGGRGRGGGDDDNGGAGRGGRGGGPGGAAAGRGGGGGINVGRTTDAVYIDRLVKAYDHVRKTIGFEIEIGTDVHNAVTPGGALRLANAVEQYRPFFVEDLFTVDDWEWYKRLREESSIGVAMGETFTHRLEWLPLVEEHLMDYFRGHISAIGGLNMARKVAMLCEVYGVKTAWHGPANVSPIGHCINLHVDLSSLAFGIGEGGNFSDQLKELYPGLPEIRDAVRYANENPGLGVDINETVAARYVPRDPGENRGSRGFDGDPKRP
jgi:mannonate dehydratase